MKKVLLTSLLFFVLTCCYGQEKRNVSAALFVQYNTALYDYTRLNNQWGLGIGLQVLFNNRAVFKPMIEVTDEAYLEDDKVYRIDPFASSEDRVGGMLNVLGGLRFQPADRIYVSLTAGPSFINGQTYFALRPAAGASFSKNQRWTGKVAFTNVFNRVKADKQDFGSLSIALGYRIF